MDIIENVKEFIEKNYPEDNYNKIHIQWVTKRALELGKKYNADLEVLEIASMLHDIDYSRGVEHHTEDSAKKAEEFLKESNYPKEKIEKVKHAIMCHTSSIVKQIERPSLEGKILYDADKMWTLSPLGITRTILHRERKGLTIEELKKRLKKQLKNYDTFFFEESKKMIKEYYELSKKFVKGL